MGNREIARFLLEKGARLDLFAAAMLGMVALDIITDIHDMKTFFSVKEFFEPDVKDREVYMSNYAVYSNLYSKFKEIKQ